VLAIFRDEKVVAQFARERIAPIAAEIDRKIHDGLPTSGRLQFSPYAVGGAAPGWGGSPAIAAGIGLYSRGQAQAGPVVISMPPSTPPPTGMQRAGDFLQENKGLLIGQKRIPPRGTVLMLSSSADHFSDLRRHSYERSYDGLWATGGDFDGTGAPPPVERRSEAGDCRGI
jgi:hypothetical protein